MGSRLFKDPDVIKLWVLFKKNSLKIAQLVKQLRYPA
jgi:hypothetical protein